MSRDDRFEIGPLTLGSRLIVGSGRFRDFAELNAAVAASGAEMITVAVRRVDIESPENVLSHLDREKLHVLPNTSGCFDAKDAVRTALLACEALETTLVKLEVIGDHRTLMPDVIETVQAAEQLVAEGCHVLPYTTDDLNIARRLQDVGCVAVMPLAAPIGSGRGIEDPVQLELLIEAVDIPVIVDAGLGVPSHAAAAMEMGVDAVLMNTAIAAAGDPVMMATAMRKAVEAGRLAHLAQPMAAQRYASASSPLTGTLQS